MSTDKWKEQKNHHKQAMNILEDAFLPQYFHMKRNIVMTPLKNC